MSSGVLQAYCQRKPPFDFGDYTLSAISPACFFSVGTMYLVSPICGYLYNTRPSLIRAGEIFGLFVVSGSLLAASYANTIWSLIVTQGIMYGIGGSFMYASTIAWLYDWFVNRRFLAKLVLCISTAIVSFWRLESRDWY